MSKTIKAFVIAGFVCILLGFAIMAGVAVFGGMGTVENVMQHGGIGWNENGFHIGDMVVRNNLVVDLDTDVKMEKEASYPAEAIENLKIELEAGRFEIKEDTVDEIIIRSSKKINISCDGDDIVIKTPERVVWFMGMTEEHKVEIILPKGKEFHKIDLEIGAGELVAESLLAKNMDVEVGAGRIEIKEFQCKESDLEIGAGEIVINSGKAEAVNTNVGMGNFQFKGSIEGDLDADCGMGNIDMELTGKEEDYNYKIDCGMGNVSIGNNSYGGAAANHKLDNHANSEFDLDCGMGNISINFTKSR